MSFSGSHKILLAGCLACVLSSAIAGEVASLEACREVQRLWMGMEEGVVRPAAFEQFRLDADGYVAIHAKDRQFLGKGDRWATLDPEQLEIERRSFEVEKVKQDQLRIKGAEDAEEGRVRRSLELHEAEGKRAELGDVLRENALPPSLRQRSREALAKLDEQIDALHAKLEPARLEKELRLLDEDYELQIARKKKQLLELEKRSCLEARAEGTLHLGEELREKLKASGPDEPLWLKSGDLIGTIVDDRHYEIHVSAAGPLLADIPQDQILVFLQDSQTGRLIAGDYARTDETDNGREISRNYVFTISDKDVEGARQAQGTRSLIHVYRKFDRPYRLVYKKDIAFSAPDVLETMGWDGLVRHLWPGSKVIQVGPQTIAVEPGNAN